jgi:transposase-like protein
MALVSAVPRRSYSADERAEALALYVHEGLYVATERTGIPKGTISSWAQRDGLQTVCVPEKVRAAAAMRSATVEERRAALAEKLVEVAELGVELEVDILRSKDANLRDVVGARTRAIHDLQLLTGAATARAEHVIVDQVDDELQRLSAALAENDPATA